MIYTISVEDGYVNAVKYNNLEEYYNNTALTVAYYYNTSLWCEMHIQTAMKYADEVHNRNLGSVSLAGDYSDAGLMLLRSNSEIEHLKHFKRKGVEVVWRAPVSLECSFDLKWGPWEIGPMTDEDKAFMSDRWYLKYGSHYRFNSEEKARAAIADGHLTDEEVSALKKLLEGKWRYKPRSSTVE